MEKSVDNLLESISDEFTNEIDLFLLNNIESKDVQLKIIELINKSFLGGINNAIDQFEKLEKDKEDERIGMIAKTHGNFMEVFTESLLKSQSKKEDGQNDTVSE